jgi:cysteinyl-tRNA synthetase
LHESEDKVDAALMDDFDTPTAMKILTGMILETNLSRLSEFESIKVVVIGHRHTIATRNKFVRPFLMLRKF